MAKASGGIGLHSERRDIILQISLDPTARSAGVDD